jgi:hypothetical protein
MLYCSSLICFSHNATQLLLKTSTFQQISDFHFIPSIEHIHFYLVWGALFALGEADFHIIKDKETLSDPTTNKTHMT